MANKKISINSEAAYSVMTYVANAASILESEVSSKLSNSFEPLTSLGFLTSLPTIQSQVTSLSSAHQKLVGEITSHLGVAEETEKGLENDYENGTYSGGGGSSGGSSGGGGGGGGYSGGGDYYGDDGSTDYVGEDTEVTSVSEGLAISTSELSELLLSIDGEYQNNFIELLNQNKEGGDSLVELLLDNTKSEKLFTVIKKIFGDKFNLDEMKLEDYKEIQKTVLNMVVKSDVSIPALSEKSILICKEYLNKVSSDHNIEPSDLILDSKYSNTLKIALADVYNGKADGVLTDEAVNNFRHYMDSIAIDNKITVTDLINNHMNLLV
jgi:hypothetical protein